MPRRSRRTLDILYPLFGYGSLTDISTLRISERITRQIKTDLAILHGWKLRNNKKSSSTHGYANIEKTNTTNYVFGKVIYVTEDELNHIDRREGVSTGHYDRIEINVSTKTNPNMKVYTYVATPESSSDVDLQTTEKYCNHIMKGLKNMEDSNKKKQLYKDDQYFNQVRQFYTSLLT